MSKRIQEADEIIQSFDEIGFEIIPRGWHTNLRSRCNPPLGAVEEAELMLPRLRKYWPEIIEILAIKNERKGQSLSLRRGIVPSN